tara:strand:+ start:820 stop:1833 length:1014 start_codon:yes stop_codon:yes gene_type:complete
MILMILVKSKKKYLKLINSMTSNILITGGAGFIGSRIAIDLLQKNNKVFVYDNLSTGKKKNLKKVIGKKNFKLIVGDLLNKSKIKKALKNIDLVYHFAANADIKNSFDDPKIDFDQNIVCTFNLLESMRIQDVKKIIFASSAAIYGEPNKIPISEKIEIPRQTSLYGAAKLSSENLISAYCEGYDFKAICFRFVSLVGPHYSHGHIIDFINQLKINPKKLTVLGDGLQKKSYLHVDDAINAINLSIDYNFKSKHIRKSFSVYNLGNKNYVELTSSIKIILNTMKVKPTITFTGGKRGWIGDNPFVFLDTKKISKLGWKPKYTIEKAIEETVRWLIQR